MGDLLFCFFYPIKMNNIHVFFHIKPMGTASAVYLVASVVGHKAVENIMLSPLFLTLSTILQ